MTGGHDRRVRLLHTAVLTIPILTLTIAVAIYLVSLAKYLSPRLAPIVAQVAAQSLNRQIRIQRFVAFRQLGVVEVEGVAVSNTPTFATDRGLPAISIKSLTIRYNLLSLLMHPAFAARSVQSIEINAPELFVERLPSGSLNLSDLIKKNPKSQPIVFTGVVSVSNGTVVVKDLLGESGFERQLVVFNKLHGTIDMSAVKTIDYSFSTQGPPSVVTEVAVRGQMIKTAPGPGGTDTPASPGFGIRVAYRHANVGYLASYFRLRQRGGVELSSGFGTGDVAVKRDTGLQSQFAVAGSASFSGMTVVVDRKSLLSSPVKNIQLSGRFTNNDAEFTGSGVLNRQRVLVHGTVLNFGSPSIFVEADGLGVNYGSIAAGLPFLPHLPIGVAVPDPVVAHTWVTGSLSDISVDASIAVPVARYQNVTMADIRSDVSYHARQLVVHSLYASGPDGSGTLSMKGALQFTKRPIRYQFDGQVKSVNLASVPISTKARKNFGPIAGSITATFVGDDDGVNLRFAIGHGTIRHIPFEAAEGLAGWHYRGPVLVRNFFVRQPGSGILVASGTIPTGQGRTGLNVNFQAAQLSLAQLGAAFVNVPMRGLLYVRGSITGGLTTPRAKVHLFGLQPSFGQYGADIVSADVSTTADTLRINKLQLRETTGIVTAKGVITDLSTERPNLNVLFNVKNTPLSFLMTGKEYAAQTNPPELPISGFVDGEGTISGTTLHPRATALLTLDDGIYQGFQLTDSKATIEYDGSRVDVRGFHVNGAGIEASGSGEFNLKSKTIAANVVADSSDIGEVARRLVPKMQVFGGLRISSTISGSISKPSATATLSSSGLTIEGTEVTFDPATFAFQRKIIALTNGPLRISSGGATYSLNSLHLDTAAQSINAMGDVVGETIPHLIAIVHQSPLLSQMVGQSLNSMLAKMPEPPTGRLTLPDISVSGALKSPDVSVSADLTNSVIAGLAINRLQTQLEVQQNSVKITKLRLTGPKNVFLEANGIWNSAGTVNGTLEASGMDIALLNPFLTNIPRLGGIVEDITVDARGLSKAPDLAASVTLDNPKVGNFSIDRIDSGEIDVKSGQLRINDLTFTKEESVAGGQTLDHTVQVTGSLPFEWQNDGSLTASIPHNLPVDLHAVLPDQSLSFIGALIPSLPVHLSGGTVSASLDVTGTLMKKEVNGSLSIADASVQPTGFQTGFTNVNLAVSLTGEEFSIKQLTATSTFGGTFTGSGGGQFSGADVSDVASFANTALGDVSLALKFNATNLVVNERKIALFDDAGASARINGNVNVSGRLLRPTIVGAFQFDKVIGSLPQASNAVSTDHGVPSFNPRFDLTFNIKQGAQFRTAQLNAQADGSIALTGSLYRPVLIGHFLVRKGQFFFPTATFRVVPTGTVDLSYHAPEPMEETIDMRATTSISVSQALLSRNPAAPDSVTAYIPSYTSTVGSQSATRYAVTVSVNGRLDTPDQLHLSFISDPPGLTNDQILAALGGSDAIAGLASGNVLGTVQDQVASVFNASVVPKLLQPFENSIGTVLGLDDFSVDYAPESPVEITVVKRLSSKVNLTYVQAVNSRSPGAVSSTLEPPEYKVQLGYSFTQRFAATISTDDQHNTIGAIEGVYNF